MEMIDFSKIKRPNSFQFGNNDIPTRHITIYDWELHSYQNIRIEDLIWSEMRCLHESFGEGTCQIGVVYYIHGDEILEKQFKTFFTKQMSVTQPYERKLIVFEMDANE